MNKPWIMEIGVQKMELIKMGIIVVSTILTLYWMLVFLVL